MHQLFRQLHEEIHMQVGGENLRVRAGQMRPRVRLPMKLWILHGEG
jgi:hypothetical protein